MLAQKEDFPIIHRWKQLKKKQEPDEVYHITNKKYFKMTV